MADDLWAELQAAEAAEQQRTHKRIITGTGPRASTLNALTKKTKKKKKKKKEEKKEKSEKNKKNKQQTTAKSTKQAAAKVSRGRAARARPLAVVVIPETDRDSIDKVLLRLQRHINELSSEALGKRKAALEAISGAVFVPFDFPNVADTLKDLVASQERSVRCSCNGRSPVFVIVVCMFVRACSCGRTILTAVVTERMA